MEIDIEVCLASIPDIVVSDLRRHFLVETSGLGPNAIHESAVIRAASSPQNSGSTEEAISNFLNGLRAYTKAVQLSRGILRVGIFYDLSETVVFPFRLSAETIKVIAEMYLSIDATGYPCTDEQADEIA